MAELDIKWPHVTYIIANHNYDNFLDDCINSVLKQNYPNNKLTLCVIDDASTDDSWNIIHKELFKDITHSNVKYDDYTIKDGYLDNGIHVVGIKNHERSGISTTRNVGMTYTAGDTDFYAILDSDDKNYPEKTKRFVLEMMQNPKQIGVVYGDFYILDVKTGIKTREFREPFDKQRLYEDCIVTNSGCLINKLALESVDEPTGFYDQSLQVCEDYDLWLRLSEKWMLLHVAEALTLVRINNKTEEAFVNTNKYNQCRQLVYQKLEKRMRHASS